MVLNVALMGLAGSGKDTAAAYLAEHYGHQRVAFADPVKRMALAMDPIVHVATDGYFVEGRKLSEIVRLFGWDAAKRRYPEVRGFLQRMASEGVRDVIGADTWVNLGHRAVRAAWLDHRPVVLTDVRFPNEVAYARRYGFLVVWIDRPGVVSDGHVSESSVGPGDADVVVVNDGPPEFLGDQVAAAMRREPSQGD